MVPAKTIEVIGRPQYIASRRFPPNDSYSFRGTDLNDLMALLVRFNTRMTDGDELRDWQNRLALMLSQAEKVGE